MLFTCESGNLIQPPTNHPSLVQYDTLAAKDFRSQILEAKEGTKLTFSSIYVEIIGSPVIVKGIHLVFEDCYIKRANSVISTTIDCFKDQANKITVEENHPFKKGQRILVISSSKYADNSNIQNGVITHVEGNQIITKNSHKKGLPSGSVVIHEFPLFHLIGGPVTLEGSGETIIDGNKENNSYTLDWRYNHTVTLRDGDIVIGLSFINMPGENIFFKGGATIARNSGKNLNGSFTHASNPPNTDPATSYVMNNIVDGVCLVSLSLNGHNEGANSFSSNSSNIYYKGNKMSNGGNGVYGLQGLDDVNLISENNIYDSFDRKIYGIADKHPTPMDLSNDIFINTD